MNLLLLEPGELTDGRAELTGRRLEHVRSVLKLKAGDTVRVGVLGGAMGEAKVASIDAGRSGCPARASTSRPS